MNDNHCATSNETNTTISTPNVDGRLFDTFCSDLFDSPAFQETSNGVRWETQNLKLAADQGNAVAQDNYGNCLYRGEGVSIDFKGAAHYFKLTADQGIG
jgi:hypothetical protein